MKTRAAVAFAANQPLEIVELDLEGPKAGEVLVEIMATGVCHTDAYTLEGKDSEGIFPSILGHEGAGIVREVGAGVTSVKPGDHVIPFLIPRCGKCSYCASDKTNLCVEAFTRLRPRTGRFSLDGKPIAQLWGLGTFADYTVMPVDTLAKVREDAPFDPICYIGCGATTGIGAALFAAVD